MRLPLCPERYQRRLGGPGADWGAAAPTRGPDPSASASTRWLLDRGEDPRGQLWWAATIHDFEHSMKVVALVARDPPRKVVGEAGRPQPCGPPGHDRVLRDA
jgi:hypothetical protein